VCEGRFCPEKSTYETDYVHEEKKEGEGRAMKSDLDDLIMFWAGEIEYGQK